jgi:hypothetical protein
MRRMRFSALLSIRRGQFKHILRWNRSLREGYLLDTPMPWMTFDAIAFLRAHVRAGVKVFEYGSGGSSLFWLVSGCELVSIEHDPEWYAVLSEKLHAFPGVDYRLIVPEPLGPRAPQNDPADPKAYRSMDERALSHSFQKYATAIDEYPEQFFDIVSVDGRARPSCLLHAAPRVKVGGLLVLDNAERGYYLEKTGEILRNFESHEFPGGGPCNYHLWQTNVYRRIK